MGKQKPRGIQADVQLWLLSVTSAILLGALGAGGKDGKLFKALPSPHQQHLSLSWILLLSAALCSNVDFG